MYPLTYSGGQKMAYIDIKTIKGRGYKYLRKSVRDGNKMKKVNLKYLGPVKPVYNVGKVRKTNASIFLRKLTEREEKILKSATKSSSAFKRDRAKIILLSSRRYIAREIAERINCGVRKARLAIKAFNKVGLKSLERSKAKGAKPKFTKEQRAEIIMIVSTDPTKLGLHFSTWSLRKLKRYLIGKEIVEYISIPTIREILISEGVRIKKSKRFQYSNDPNFAKKNL